MSNRTRTKDGYVQGCATGFFAGIIFSALIVWIFLASLLGWIPTAQASEQRFSDLAQANTGAKYGITYVDSILAITPPQAEYYDLAAHMAEEEYNYFLELDPIFDTLNQEDRARFIRYWIAYYGNSVSGDKAVGIAISETNLGAAGVGASKNNLFGCKVNASGAFVSSFPSFETHRESCAALVAFYSKYGEWHLWSGLSSGLGR